MKRHVALLMFLLQSLLIFFAFCCKRPPLMTYAWARARVCANMYADMCVYASDNTNNLAKMPR